MLASCSSKEGVKVRGEIKGAKNGTIYLMGETEEGELIVVDSVDMQKDGKLFYMLHREMQNCILCHLTAMCLRVHFL